MALNLSCRSNYTTYRCLMKCENNVKFNKHSVCAFSNVANKISSVVKTPFCVIKISPNVLFAFENGQHKHSFCDGIFSTKEVIQFSLKCTESSWKQLDTV